MIKICFIVLVFLFSRTTVGATYIDGYFQAPKGDLNSFSVSGWACEKGQTNPISVGLYVGYSKSSAVPLITNTANQLSENAIRERCSSDGEHRFTFNISPEVAVQYSNQNIYIKAEFDVNTTWIASAAQYSIPNFSAQIKLVGFVQAPKGDISSFSVSGWACEQSSSLPISVQFFIGESKTDAIPILKINANSRTENAVRKRCNTDGDHRFKFDVPQDVLYQYSGQNIYILAESSGKKSWLSSTQQYKLPEFPQTHLVGNVEGIKEANGAFYIMGWACQTYVEQQVLLNVFTRSEQGEVVSVVKNSVTNTISERAVSNECKTQTNRHRFRARIPENIVQSYAGQELFVESKSAYGNRKLLLSSFGTIKIPTRAPKLVDPNHPPNIVVFFTDDQGYADLGIQDVLQDVKTPNIDALAMNGARFTQGYVTAPQCSPSRAAMITGQYQERFGMDENHYIPMSLEATTLASRLQEQGYKTGMLGKWHLEIMGNSKEWASENFPELQPFDVSEVPIDIRHQYLPHERGFDEVVAGYSGSYFRNMDMRGKNIPVEVHQDNQFRVDLVSDASKTFIDKHWQSPFYLYISHYAPHVPMEATQKYLDRFSEDMPLRRRYALAMLSAIDDGVGQVVEKLRNYNLLDNTLILFISDNGAPLGDDMTDSPITNNKEAWNGSRNDPYTGEKGMLTEGALRVPYIAHWPKQIPMGQVIDTPVSTLDATYTTAKVAGIEELSELDGLDLLPLIDGQVEAFDQRPLFWRFYSQRAIREGNWKYMQAGIEREYLFDMSQAQPEEVNFINSYPDIAKGLKDKYWIWAKEMQRPEPLVEIPVPFMKRVDSYLPAPLP